MMQHIITHQRIAFFFVILALGGLAIVPVYASNGAVVLLVLGVLASWHFRANLQSIKIQLFTSAGGFLIALIAWAFISLFWSQIGLNEIWATFSVLLLCVAGFIFMGVIEALNPHQTRIAQTVLISACVAMVGLFLFEFLTDGVFAKFLKGRTGRHLDFIGRGLSILISVIWPIIALILMRKGNKIGAAILIFVAGATAYQYPNEAMFLGLAVGFFTFIAGLWMRRATIVFVFGTFMLLVITGPMVAHIIMNVPAIKEKVVSVLGHRQHRLNIWEFVSSKVEDRPLIGHGFDMSQHIGAEENQYYLETREQFGHSRWRLKLPLHPHNISLQIWLELGLIGIIFYLGIVFGICRIIWTWRGPPVWAAALGASTASYLTVSSISFGAWQSWWLATAWLVAGIFILVNKTPDLSTHTASHSQGNQT
jgi:O-antigen ligase